jgi:hypothetical protein
MAVVRLAAGSHASAARPGSIRARAVVLRGVCGSGSVGWPAAVLCQGAKATREDGIAVAGGRPVHGTGHSGPVRGRDRRRQQTPPTRDPAEHAMARTEHGDHTPETR